MAFIPLARPSPDDGYPQVSPDLQASRDADAERLVGAELATNDTAHPDAQAALETEYRQRFGKEPPQAPRGFVPLGNSGFTPLASNDGQMSPAHAILLNNPLAAAGEAALNLGSQAIGLPVAGIAGLGAIATHALGLTSTEPADVVRNVGDAMTYAPRGEYGKAAAGLVAIPFEKLAELGQSAGGHVLDATGSPALATIADTAINALPMAIDPALRGARALKARMAERPADAVPLESAAPPAADIGTGEWVRPDDDVPFMETPPQGFTTAHVPLRDVQRDGYTPLTERVPDIPARTTATQLVDSPEMVQAKGAHAALEALPQAATVDEAIALASRAIDTPLVERPPIPVEVPVELPPGRFSNHPDAMLNRQYHLAAPDVQAEIGAELQRRAILAEDYAANQPTVPASRWEVQQNSFGNQIISGTLEDIQALRPQLAQVGISYLPRAAGEGRASLMIGLKNDPAALNQVLTAADRPLPETQDMAGAVQNSWAPGANYVPMVDQVRAPAMAAKSVADLPEPIRRERIISDLAKALDTAVYEGRIKGNTKLGFFRPSVGEVRIKHANDIEVTAHEIAHLLDHRIPDIQRAYFKDKALRDELRSVSYDQKNVKEGFAEAVRLWATQPEALEAKAPKAYAWLESFVESHPIGPALRAAQGQMTGWFGQDALNRARSKIGTDKPLTEILDGFWDKFRQSTTDDLHGIYRMERGMSEGKLAANGAYESARLSRASSSIADGSVRWGYPVKNADGSFKFEGKGLEEILKPVADSLDDALLYFVGRSARELQLQNREHLFTKGEIDAMIKLRTPERDQAFKEYQAWNKGILDFAEAEGVINPETRRLWKRTQYLPFHRVDQPGGLKGKPGDWSGIQALTGGTTNIKDVLGNMIGNAAMLIDKAVKNEARLKVAELSQRPEGAKFMVKIEPGERPVKISGDQVLKAMFDRYGILISGDAPAFFEFLLRGQPPAGGNVVAVLKAGKPEWYEVGDPLLLRSLQAIDRPLQSEVVKWLGLPKRIGQTTITMVPDFWLANMARDTIMGSVMSRAGFRPILDSLDGMRLRMTSDPIYKDWVANGGGLSSIYLDEAAFRTKLERFYGRQGIDYRTVLDAPAKLLHAIETLGDAFEASTRLGEYKRAVQAGQNPRHAAYLAREVSTDFATKGDSKALGFMYDTIMFLRAAVVSWDRLYRGVAHDPNRGAIAAKAGMVAMASIGLYLLNRDDPRYADLADWDRDANWHFFIGDQHFRYPKIWEIGAIGSAAERSVEKLMAGDPVGLGKDMVRIIGQTFSLNLMPQILAPLAEQAANRNSFTKAPIETPGMENVQPFLRAKPGTSETLKAAGMATRDLPEALQVNPARAEALLRGYFNTWALYGLMLTDKAFYSDSLPEKRADELPVLRRFYASEPAKHTKYESTFYELLQQAKRLHGTLKELDDMHLSAYADAKEQNPLAGEAKPLERAQKNLAVINRDTEQVLHDVTLTPAEKRQKLDALTIERNALLKAAVLDSQAAQARQP